MGASAQQSRRYGDAPVINLGLKWARVMRVFFSFVGFRSLSFARYRPSSAATSLLSPGGHLQGGQQQDVIQAFVVFAWRLQWSSYRHSPAANSFLLFVFLCAFFSGRPFCVPFVVSLRCAVLSPCCPQRGREQNPGAEHFPLTAIPRRMHRISSDLRS